MRDSDVSARPRTRAPSPSYNGKEREQVRAIAGPAQPSADDICGCYRDTYPQLLPTVGLPVASTPLKTRRVQLVGPHFPVVPA